MANEAGGRNDRDDSNWNEETNQERLEAVAPVHLNGSDGSSSVAVGV